MEFCGEWGTVAASVGDGMIAVEPSFVGDLLIEQITARLS